MKTRTTPTPSRSRPRLPRLRHRRSEGLHNRPHCAICGHREDLVARWDRERIAAPGKSRIILTHTNDEVRELNLMARDRLRQAGALGHDVSVQVERGERLFAAGDRLMFLKNDRGLGVKNGMLGEIGREAGEGDDQPRLHDQPD